MQWRHLYLHIAVLWKPYSFWMPALSTMDILILRAHEWRANFFAPLFSKNRSAIEMQIYNKCKRFLGAMMRIWDIKECTFMFLCWNKWLRRTFWPPLQSCAEILAVASNRMLDIDDIIGQSVLLANLCFVGDLLW